LDFELLKNAIADLEDEKAYELVNEVMADGGTQVEAALKACQEGMDIVGKRFEAQEYFVADLIFAGEIMSKAMEILKPALAAKRGDQVSSKMILCTVEGDLHDIGKNIVKSILEATGFEVLDLGIDVPADVIVKTAKEQGIKIIALSGVLTLAIDSMKKTVDAFAAAGMRDSVKIIIGGAPVTEDICRHVGADAWAINPQDTAQICRKWASGE